MPNTHDPHPPQPAAPSKPVGICKPSATKPRPNTPSIAKVKYFLKCALKKNSQDNLPQVLNLFRSGALAPDISCFKLIVAILDHPRTQHIKQEFQDKLDQLLHSTQQPTPAPAPATDTDSTHRPPSPDPSYPPALTADPTLHPTSPSPPPSPVPTPHLDHLTQFLLHPPDRFHLIIKPQKLNIRPHIDNHTTTLSVSLRIRLTPPASHLNRIRNEIVTRAELPFEQDQSTDENSQIYCLAADHAAQLAIDELNCAFQALKESILGYLDTELQQACEGWRKLNDLDSNVEAFRTFKRLVLSEKYGALYGCKVLVYGSATSGLGLPDSDVDIALVLPKQLTEGIMDNEPQKPKRTEVLAFLMHCANAVGMRSIDLVSSARVPLLRYRDPKAKVDVDVTLGGEDPTLMSRLFRRHMQEDARVWQLCMGVKHWARKRMVSGVFEGCINAMGWCIMVIFFLQHVCRPPIAGLFRVRGRRQKRGEMRTIVRVPWKGNVGRGKSKESIGQLLIRFFGYFGETFDYERYAITINCHSMIEAEALRQDGNAAVFIEQPLKLGQNVVEHVSQRALNLTKRELMRGHKECLNGCKIETLFEEANDEERAGENWMFDDK